MRRFSWNRHGIWVTAGACVAGLVVVAVAHYAVLGPSSLSSAPVTIASLSWYLQQGRSADGSPWFAESWINQSGPYSGFPYQVPSGGSFRDALTIVSMTNQSHPLCTAVENPPLYTVATTPPLPTAVDPGEDTTLFVTISVHAAAGATVTGIGVIDSTQCTLLPGP
jgi:hypothetical protein